MGGFEKLRCLIACPEPPLPKRGGGIAILQSIYSLSNYYEIDYIGQPIPNGLLPNGVRCLTNDKAWPSSSNLRRKINIAFWGWHDIPYLRRFLRHIDISPYSVCFLEFPWYWFCSRSFLKSGIPVITRFHNVERDVLMDQITKEKNVSFLLRLPHVLKMEKKAIEGSDGLVFLTENDLERYKTIYPDLMAKRVCKVIPLAVKSKNQIVLSENTKRVLLCTATLNYGPNKEGILWFVEKVWPQIPKSFKLIIAGCNPDSDFKKRVSLVPGIETVYNPSPELMESLFSRAAFSIAPIFWGSGMKVKVAESLAAGVIPIGTPQSFIGYSITNGDNCFIFKNEKEAVDIINMIHGMSIGAVEEISNKARMLYHNYYTLSISSNMYKELIDDVNASRFTY